MRASVEKGCSLERRCHSVGADEAGNEHCRGSFEMLVGQIDGLDRHLTPQLLDLERMAFETGRAVRIETAREGQNRY